jgi:hypothetical protein
MTTILSDVVLEYMVPPGVGAVRIEAESGGSGAHSSAKVTIQLRPGATLRLHLACLPAQESSEASSARPGDGSVGTPN